MSLYLSEGRPTFAFRTPDLTLSRIGGNAPLPAGPVTLELSFERRTSGATVSLMQDGRQIGTGVVNGDLPTFLFSSSETFDIGADTDSAASPDYRGPYPLEGRIREVRVDVSPLQK